MEADTIRDICKIWKWYWKPQLHATFYKRKYLNPICKQKPHGAKRWVVLKELTVTQLVKKISAFKWVRKFITVFKRAHHWPLSSARWIPFIISHPISLRSITIISSHLRLGLPCSLFPLGFPIKGPYTFLTSPMGAKCPVSPILLDYETRNQSLSRI